MDIDEETRLELESALADLNAKVLDHHAAFEIVRDRLKQTADLLPLGENNPVLIEAVPSKVFDILSRTQVTLASQTGARIPILRHGSGTQSLAVICLFEAFLQSRLQDKYDEHSEPLLALEEPEAHLHPSAIKAVGSMLQKFAGQKLISTHSGDLLAGVPLHKIRRLRRTNGKITLHKIEAGVFTADEINKLNYHVRATRGAVLFSRCWLLVEGETEALLLPECARALGYDLYSDGVSCIEFSQSNVETLIKLADQLGIEWFVLVDRDHEGNKYRKSALKHLNTRNADDHIRILDHGAIEVFLCMEGFGDFYKTDMSEQKKDEITAPEGAIDYWQQIVKAQKSKSKPRVALAVAERMVANSSVPTVLEGVIKQVRELARSTG